MRDRFIYCRYSSGIQSFWAGNLGGADTGRGLGVSTMGAGVLLMLDGKSGYGKEI